MSKAGHVLSVLAMLVMLAGCGGGAVGPVNASHTAAAGMGTEAIRAVNAAPGATRVTIEASGVFSDEGTLAVPIGDPRTITFTFTRGNMVVLNATGPTSGPMRLDRTTCAFSRAARPLRTALFPPSCSGDSSCSIRQTNTVALVNSR